MPFDTRFALAVVAVLVAIAGFTIPEIKTWPRIILGVIFLTIVAGLIWYSFNSIPPSPPDTTPTIPPTPDSTQTLDVTATPTATLISKSDQIIVFANDYDLVYIYKMSKAAESFEYKPLIYKKERMFYAFIDSSSDSDLQKLRNYFGSGVNIKKLSEECPNPKLDADGRYYLCID